MMGNKLTLPAELPDEQDLRAVLAYNMRLFRVNKGWSQEELARQCGLDRTYCVGSRAQTLEHRPVEYRKNGGGFGRGGVSVAAAAAGTVEADDQFRRYPTNAV